MNSTLAFTAERVRMEMEEGLEAVEFENEAEGSSFAFTTESQDKARKKNPHLVRAWWHHAGRGADEFNMVFTEIRIGLGRFKAKFTVSPSSRSAVPFDGVDITYPEIDAQETAGLIAIFKAMFRDKTNLISLDIPGMPEKLPKLPK